MQRPKKDIEGSRRERRKKIDTPSFYVQLRCTICHTGTRATVSGDKNSQITTVDSDPACLFFWRSLSRAQNIRCNVFSQLDSQMLSNSIEGGEYPVSNLIRTVIIRCANSLLFLICALSKLVWLITEFINTSALCLFSRGQFGLSQKRLVESHPFLVLERFNCFCSIRLFYSPQDNIRSLRL